MAMDSLNVSKTITTDPQPAPVGGKVAVWPLVLADIEQRNKAGIAKYGTQLRTFNGREAMIDLYQELLDAVVYARQAIEEQKHRGRLSGDDRKLIEEVRRDAMDAVARNDTAAGGLILLKLIGLIDRLDH